MDGKDRDSGSDKAQGSSRQSNASRNKDTKSSEKLMNNSTPSFEKRKLDNYGNNIVLQIIPQ